MIATTYPGLTYRTLAMLRAVAAGRAEISCSCEPDLFVDGLPCCDQVAARALVHAGLVRPARHALVGDRVPAVLTTAGLDALDVRPEARRAAFAHGEPGPITHQSCVTHH